VLAAESFFSRDGLGQFGFRWLHILAGITWIGLLYYFNFVQVPAFAEYGDEGRARNIAIDKIARRALWWFRWSALSTFVIGILITMVARDYYSNNFGKPFVNLFQVRPPSMDLNSPPFSLPLRCVQGLRSKLHMPA